MTPNNGGLVLESQGRPPALCGGGGGGHVVGDNEDLKKGPWTAAEDQILMEYVKRHGEGNWNSVLRNSGLNRCGKSCRLRWVNHLRPHLKKGAFSPEEQRLILELHAKCGNKWAGMASQLPGRTDNEIKNYWNTRVKKRHRQGLPLYPHDISQFHSQSHSHSHFDSQPSTTPTFSLQTQSPTQAHNHHLPPLSPTPHQPKPISTLTSFPLFDPINTNTSSSFSSSSSSFTFHRPPPIIGAPLGYKRYRDSIGFSPPISPNPQRSSSILRTSSMPDIASFQLNDTNQMSNTASFQLNDKNQMSDIASFQLNNVTSMFDIGSFQLNGTSSIPDIASFQLNNISSTSGIEFLALTNTSSMSGIASFQFNDTYSTPYIGSVQFSHTLNPSLPQMPQTHLEYSDSLLLPNSNQVFQTQSEITIDTKVGLARMGTTVAADDTHSSKGLLDDLLQEVDVLACGDGNNNSIRSAPGVLGSFEDNHVLDGYDHWLQSTSSMESSLLDEVLYASC